MFSLPMILSNSHTNNKKQMKDMAIVNALQDIEGIHINTLSTFNNYLQDNNLGVFLLYRQIEIYDRPVFAEKIILKTYPYNTTAVSGYRHIYICDEAGNSYIKTNAFGAFVNLDTYRPTRIPKEIVASLNDGIKDDTVLDLPRKVEYDPTDEAKINQITIKKSHIDRYNHVNNAFYIEFALDSYEGELTFNMIRAEYIKSFKLNDIVNVYYKKYDENKHLFALKNISNEINAIIEFSYVNR